MSSESLFISQHVALMTKAQGPDLAGKLRLDASEDVFAKLFTDMQVEIGGKLAPSFKAERTEKPETADRACPQKPPVREKCAGVDDSDDRDDREEVAASDEKAEARKTEEARDDDNTRKCCSHENKEKAEARTNLEEKGAQAAAQDAPQPEPKPDMDGTAVEADAAAADTLAQCPEDPKKAALQAGLAVSAEAGRKSCVNAEGQGGDGGKNTESMAEAALKGQAGSSFRPVIANNNDAAGKGNALAADAAAAGEAGAEVTVKDFGAPVENLGQKIKSAIAKAKAEGQALKGETANIVHAAQDEFKAAAGNASDFSENGPKGNPLKEASPDKPQDSSASPSLPAAGSRANSVNLGLTDPKLTGSPASPPSGSTGGGSPPPAATAKGEGAINITALAGLESAKASANASAFINLAKGAGGVSPAEQVAVQLYQAAKGKSGRITIQLSPADLGRVDVRLDFGKDGMVRALVIADNPQTYDMLQKDARGLERALNQAGLQTDAGSLSFNLRGGDAEAQMQTGSNGKNPWLDFANDRLTSETEIPVAAYQIPVAEGRIDIRV